MCVLPGFSLCSGYSQEVVCYTLGNIPQMPSAPRLVRAGVTWVTLQWNKPEGCSPEEVVTYTLEIQEDENVSFVDFVPLRVFCVSHVVVNVTGHHQTMFKLRLVQNQSLNTYHYHHRQQPVLPTVIPVSVTFLSFCSGKPENSELSLNLSV